MTTQTTERYWIGDVGTTDDFGGLIGAVFYDAATHHGPWATMNHSNWLLHRRSPTLGTGHGQKYQRQSDGRWLKVKG